MISFRQYVESHMNIKVPRGNISGAWFAENGLSMVVACSCCGMTMASPSAWVDDQGFAYCSECADIEEEQ